MRVVVIGPGMENRQQPLYALNGVDAPQLTPTEHELCQIAQDRGSEDIQIIGVPWVNPKGHGRAVVHLDDYLGDPVFLLRAVTVALLAIDGRNADAVCIVVDDGSRLEEARQWVTSHARKDVPLKQVKWGTSSELKSLCYELLALK